MGSKYVVRSCSNVLGIFLASLNLVFNSSHDQPLTQRRELLTVYFDSNFEYQNIIFSKEKNIYLLSNNKK